MAPKLLRYLLILSSIMINLPYGLTQTPMQVAGIATITATTSGNWSATTTWGGILPTNDDRVLIPSGITVIVHRPQFSRSR